MKAFIGFSQFPSPQTDPSPLLGSGCFSGSSFLLLFFAFELLLSGWWWGGCVHTHCLQHLLGSVDSEAVFKEFGHWWRHLGGERVGELWVRVKRVRWDVGGGDSILRGFTHHLCLLTFLHNQPTAEALKPECGRVPVTCCQRAGGVKRRSGEGRGGVIEGSGTA